MEEDHDQPTCGALVGLWIAVEYDDTWCRGLVKQHVATKEGENYLVRTPPSSTRSPYSEPVP
jgi:hypothetical protein